MLAVDVHPHVSMNAAKYRGFVGDNENIDSDVEAEGIARLIFPERSHKRTSSCHPSDVPGPVGRYPCRVRYRRLRFHRPIDDDGLRLPVKRPILTDDTFGFAVRSAACT